MKSRFRFMLLQSIYSVAMLLLILGTAKGQEPRQKDISQLVIELKGRNRIIRFSAASALGKMGAAAAPAVPTISKLLKDKDSDVRSAASSALSKIAAAAKHNAE